MAVEAELVRELSRQGKAGEVHERAARVLPRADEVSRARLLMAESIVDLLHQQHDAEGSAQTMLQEATALLRVNGEREWEADAWLSLGFGADLRAGRLGLAVEHIERALALCSPGTQMRGRVLTFLAEALSHAGRADDAEAALREVAELASLRDDVALTAYVAWSAALVATRRGDLAGDPRAAGRRRVAPRRVARAAGRRRLPRRGGRDAGDARAVRRRTRPARGRVGGCPRRPTSRTPSTWPSWCWPRAPATRPRCRRWPRAAAHAADRPGGSGCSRPGPPSGPASHDEARRLAADALAEADAIGHPEIVEAGEPELALVGAGDAERRAGASRRVRRRPRPAAGPRRPSRRADGLREPRRGDETTLLAAVAARREVDVDDLLDLLWPSEDDAVARRRLRNTLNRLRGSVGDVVVRRATGSGWRPTSPSTSTWCCRRPGSGTPCPSSVSRPPAARCRSCPATSATPGGDPALDDLRDELGLAVGALADRVGDAATTSGELGEAARWLAQARRLDRYDEARAVRLVQVLRAVGRDAEADEVARDAVLACEELGVAPSPELARLAPSSV